MKSFDQQLQITLRLHRVFDSGNRHRPFVDQIQPIDD